MSGPGREESNGLTVSLPIGSAKAKGTLAVAALILLLLVGSMGWMTYMAITTGGREHDVLSRALLEQTQRLESIFWAVLLSQGQRNAELDNLPLPGWVQELKDRRARDEWLRKQPTGR